ncbi:carbohydrate ABC transport system permease [Gammaproteobacteria bacterium]|nr:carbohydrate ABC transport system permease [Gammaproteobacteria bacterium]
MTTQQYTNKHVAQSKHMKLLKQFGILPVLILICTLFYIMAENFGTTDNMMNILRQASINIVLACGVTFVILTAGIDLSVGSILGASAVTTMIVSLTSLSWLSIPAGILAGILMGGFNGSLIAFLKMPPFIVTLGTLTGLRGVSYLLADGTTVINNDIAFEWIGNSDFMGIPWLAIIALSVVIVCWFILKKTVLGLHIYAVGGNPQAARLSGIRVSLVLLFCYVMCGICSALGGLMLSSRLYSANGMLGTGYELDAIAAVVLGGTSLMGGIGSVWGTFFGALIIAILNNGLTLMNVDFFWQLVVKGSVIIIAVLVDQWRQKATG